MRHLLIAITFCWMPAVYAETLPTVRVADNGEHFVRGDADQRFVVWGVNYDHNGDGRVVAGSRQRNHWPRDHRFMARTICSDGRGNEAADTLIEKRKHGV